MKLLDQVLESIKNLESIKESGEVDTKYAALYEKYKDIDPAILSDIIKAVETAAIPAEEPAGDALVVENDQKTDVKDVAEVKPSDSKVTDANDEPATQQVNELDASEDEQTDELPKDDVQEDSEEEDDELIIEESDEPEHKCPNCGENPCICEEDEDEGFDEYKDELDIVEGEEEEIEPIEENAEKIDENPPVVDTGIEGAEKASKNEDNSGAKAAIANRENKGAFSSDVDALTDYLNKY